MIGVCGEGTSPRRLGADTGLSGRASPLGEVRRNKLREVAHMGKGMLQLSQLTVNPALSAAVLGKMGLKKRYRKHLGAAFFTHCTAQVSFFDGNNFRADLGYWLHRRVLLQCMV
jgi:hypothetical protein